MTSAERYRLVRTVGTGGMAQIMEAVALGMDGFERRVAIKRLLPQHARDSEHRRMFLQEARITSRLHHGGIVSIFDYGLIDGAAFLAMEFVEGLDTLRALSLTRSPVPEGIALHLVAEIGHALAYIHALRDDHDRSLSIVHRDVSPQNILLSWDGDVRLSDFGIASFYLRRGLTTGGVIKGKLRYMAPEQARGERVDSAADVYALGATLDALLGSDATGPSTSPTETAHRVRQAQLRDVSPEVCDVIGACLANDPELRPLAGAVAARAGVLASQRLGRDGRGALREWLRPLRADARRNSALDDLMGLCLVPVGPARARTYTITQVATVVPAEVTIVPSEISVVASAPAPRPLRRAVVRQARTASLFVAALSSFLVAGDRRLDLARAELAPAPIVATAAPSHSSRGRVGRPRPAAAAVASASPRPVAWVRVGGPTFAGARVSIDGANAGFAPVELFRPPGAHKIVVIAPASGRTLWRRTVRLGDQHTRTAPLRILQ